MLPSVSLQVSVTWEPFDATTADTSRGGPSVELFVTAVAENERASLPAVSCTALFVVKLLADGALYATVTVEEPNTDGDKVRITVEPLIDRAETVVGEPSTKTAKSVVAAVVALSDSL